MAAPSPIHLRPEVQDQVNHTNNRQYNIDPHIELADIGMTLLDFGGLLEHIVFVFFSHNFTLKYLIFVVVQWVSFGIQTPVLIPPEGLDVGGQVFDLLISKVFKGGHD